MCATAPWHMVANFPVKAHGQGTLQLHPSTQITSGAASGSPSILPKCFSKRSISAHRSQSDVSEELSSFHVPPHRGKSERLQIESPNCHPTSGSMLHTRTPHAANL